MRTDTTCYDLDELAHQLRILLGQPEIAAAITGNNALGASRLSITSNILTMADTLLMDPHSPQLGPMLVYLIGRTAPENAVPNAEMAKLSAVKIAELPSAARLDSTLYTNRQRAMVLAHCAMRYAGVYVDSYGEHHEIASDLFSMLLAWGLRHMNTPTTA